MPFLNDLDRRVLRLLDDHPDGLSKEQIVQYLQGVVTLWDLQEQLVKGVLEMKEGKIRASARFR